MISWAELHDDIDACIRDVRSHAECIPWVNNSRDSLGWARTELLERGWEWNGKHKQFERDGWYLFLRSQGELASPIAQWSRLQWEPNEVDGWGLMHCADGSVKDVDEWAELDAELAAHHRRRRRREEEEEGSPEPKQFSLF